MAGYTIECTSTKATFYISGLVYGDRLRFYLRYSSTTSLLYDVTEMATSYYHSKEFTLPQSGTTYVGNVEVNGVLLGALSFTAPSSTPTPPPTPTVSPNYSQTHDSNSITFSVWNLQPNDVVRFIVRRNPDPGWYHIDNTYYANSSSMTQSFSFSSSVAGQSLACNVLVNGNAIRTEYFEIKKARPQNWYWSSYSDVRQGQPIQLSASTWNLFCSRINAFRDYKGLSDYSFTQAVSGGKMYASQANEAWYAINGITGHGTMPSTVTSGTLISAAFMISLQNALNAIP